MQILRPGILALAALALAVPAVQAKDNAERTTVGATNHAALEAGESKDYALNLGKGDYWIIWDAKRSNEQSSNLMGEIQLLKTNGVIVDSRAASLNLIGLTGRAGAKFHVAKPFAARLRVKNDLSGSNDAEEMWVTVLPAKSLHFVPFGFGAEVQPAKVDTEEGVGGTLEKDGEAYYYRATLPPGRWSVSLGLKSEKSGNLGGAVDLLDPNGLSKEDRFVNVNEIGTEARKEGILTVVKPRTVLFRVVSGFRYSAPISYDLTIRKATD